MKANEIPNILNQFKDSTYKKILINGNWGIGKTKYITDTLENYENSCYVSLFGKKDVNSIIQEIYFRIIEKAPRGNIKKFMNTIREKMGKFDVSVYGVSLSIPVIENLHKTLDKELNRKDEFIIVFDDLERKHRNLDIREVFGIVDSLSKIEKVKIILVSALEQFDPEDEKTFQSYQEKAIDRSYKIEKFADEAPIQILGESVWATIEPLAEDFQFRNLRTFEKTSLFIKEVIKTLGEDIFSDLFTKSDLYRMCFASVFFIVEHNCEMKLMNNDPNDQNAAMRRAIQFAGESGVVEYLNRYILKNSLDNVMSTSLLLHIKKWYETGTYNKNELLSLITSISANKEEPHNFYSSEPEIIATIENTKNQITSLNGDENLEYIINKISNTFDWCEVLSIDFGINDDDIVKLLENSNLIKLDVTKSLYEHEITIYHRFSNERIAKLIKQINETIKHKYCMELLNHIDIEYNKETYFKSFVKQFKESLYYITDETLRTLILERISGSNFFFPIPSKKISESQWNWCHLINNLIKEIAQQWNVPYYYEEFKSFVCDQQISKTDKLLQHRLKFIFEVED
ncbi:P-loop NTPase fold protein [Paenibacillus rubinfantis]|uniref:P-loop NTPase fold protein n=1 Tax=Paenibacillus rubinfantis TaxID=1720296 RepID=UPI00073EE270|nr:P-loop NTPase fold protein [Paenibacillus rubinfantis]